jgi:hypothetical protein
MKKHEGCRCPIRTTRSVGPRTYCDGGRHDTAAAHPGGPGAALYLVEYRATADGSGPWVPATPTGDTAYVLTGLDTNQPYQARVTARSLFETDPPGMLDAWSGRTEGDAAASAVVTATPVAALTVAPAGLRVVWVQDTQVSLQWDAAPRAAWYIVDLALAEEAYGVFEPWRPYGVPPAQVAGTSLVVPALETGGLYRFRVRAFNQHVATATYPGFAGPSATVLARPVPAPARPARFAVLQPRILFAGVAGAGSTSKAVALGPPASNASAAYTGAFLRVLDGAGDMAPRRVVDYNSTARSAIVDPPLAGAPAAGAALEIERYPLSADVGGGGLYTAAVQFRNQPDAFKYQVLRRSSPDAAGLVHAEWVIAAALDGSASSPPASKTGACAGLGGATLGAPGFVDAVTRPWAAAAPAPGQAPASAVPDVCMEVSGLQEGWVHELAVQAGNKNVDWSEASASVRLIPRPPPTASPAGPLVVLEQGADSIVLYWPPPPVDAGMDPDSQFPSGESFRVYGRVLGTTVWTTIATLPPLAVQFSGALVEVRAGGALLRLDPSTAPAADGALVGMCVSVAVAGGVGGLPGGTGISPGGWETRRIGAYSADQTALLDAAITPVPTAGTAYAVSRGYALVGLSRGAGYEFAVCASNAAGPATLPPLRGTVPAPPRSAQVSRLVPGGPLELSWTRPSQATFFTVDAAVGPSNAFLVAATGIAGTSVVLTAANLALPAPGASVFLRIRSCGDAVGPCERIGASVQAFAAAGDAGGIVDAWISSKTRSSFIVQCVVNYTTVPPAYFVVLVCNDAGCNGVGDSYYP